METTTNNLGSNPNNSNPNAMGKTVGMDVIPHTDRYSEQVLAYISAQTSTTFHDPLKTIENFQFP